MATKKKTATTAETPKHETNGHANGYAEAGVFTSRLIAPRPSSPLRDLVEGLPPGSEVQVRVKIGGPKVAIFEVEIEGACDCEPEDDTEATR